MSMGDVYTDVLELHTIELRKKPDREQPSALDELCFVKKCLRILAITLDAADI